MRYVRPGCERFFLINHWFLITCLEFVSSATTFGPFVTRLLLSCWWSALFVLSPSARTLSVLYTWLLLRRNIFKASMDTSSFRRSGGVLLPGRIIKPDTNPHAKKSKSKYVLTLVLLLSWSLPISHQCVPRISNLKEISFFVRKKVPRFLQFQCCVDF